MKRRAPPVVPLFLVALVAAFVVALVSVRSGAAATPGAEREARRAFQSAEVHFRAGLFAEALAEYQAGYAASPLPGFLINIAQCQRRLGDLSKARATYQKFVLVAPDSPLVPEVQALIGELDKLLADLGESATDAGGGAESRSDGSPGSSPVPAAIPAAVPAVAISAAPAVPPAEARASPRRRWWIWGAVGAAVVGGTVAAFALSSPGTTTLHDGSLGTLRR